MLAKRKPADIELLHNVIAVQPQLKVNIWRLQVRNLVLTFETFLLVCLASL